MNFLNYFKEFFLFRWLFGSHKHKETTHPTSDPHWEDRDLSDVPSQHYANTQSDPDDLDDYNDLHDYSDIDDYDTMDDYDTIDNYDDIDDDF